MKQVYFFSLTFFLCFSQIASGQKSKESNHTKSVQTTKEEDDENEDVKTSALHSKQLWFKLIHQPNVNYFAVKKSYDAYFKAHPLENSGPKEYGLSWLKTKLFYLDVYGRVQKKPAINLNKIDKAKFAPPVTVTDTTMGSWRMLGPRNTFQGSGSGLGNNGGYAYCVRIDPTDANKLFCSFVTGGLWVSADNGAAWHLADANLPADSYYDIDVCKANNNIAYAIGNSAVIKSTDGGMSWNVTSLNKTNYTGKAYDIAVSPTNADIIVARWGTTIYRSTDGGASWTSIITGLKDFSIWDSNLNSEVLDWDNNNSNNVYFTNRSDNQNYVEVYKSTDAGLTFTLFKTLTLSASATGTITGWSKICTATNSPAAMYILIGSGTSSYSHTAVQMYKLDVVTGNILLQRINMIDGINTDYGSKTSLHHGDIAMDITDENKIAWGSYSQQNVQYSTNNGVSFYTSSTSVHSDLRGVFMANGKVILATDGSALISTDNGNNFNIVTKAISNHELWGFGAAFKSDILAAGCNHGPLMLREFEGAGGWYTLLGADQGNSDCNPVDSVSAYSQGYDSYHITRTGIKTFTNSAQQIDPGGIYSYFNTLEFHPNLYHTLITHHAGGYPSGVPQATRDIWKKSLIRSDDNGITVKVVYTFANQLFREKICVSDTNRIYAVVGLTNNTLMKTTNGGSSFTDITPAVAVTGASVRNISDIAVSDVNPNEIWVSYSGVQNTCKILHSTDGGVTYTNLTQSILTTNPITKIIFQRSTNGGIYAANTTGVYYRNNVMTNWVKLGNGLPDMDIRFMFINYYKGKLLIGTSRGAWDNDLYEHSATKAQITASEANPTCQSPVVTFRDYSVVSNGGAGATYSWSFPGGTPSTSTQEAPAVTYLGAATGKYNVSLTVTDQYGTSTQVLNNFINYTAVNCCEAAPTGWTKTDLGTATVPSELCYTPLNGNYKITSHASGLGGTSDNIPFIYKPLVGDGQIIARVNSVTNTWNYAGGIMIRKSLAANSAFVFLNSLDARGVFDIFRNTDGAGTGYHAVTGLAMPMWLKLLRESNTITAYYSLDSITWTTYQTFNLPLGNTVYVGIAATGNGCVTNIDRVSVGPPPPCVGGSENGCAAIDTIPGRAINFTNYTYIANVPFSAPATNNFTISGWIKPTGILGEQSSILAWDNGYLYLGQSADNQLEYVWNSGDAATTWSSGLFVPADKWSFIAMVIEPVKATLYLNDKMVSEIKPQGLSVVTNPVIGNSNPGAGYFLGQMDEFAIWNRALSANEIDSLKHLTKELIATTSSAKYDPALVGYFQFNDNNASSSFNLINKQRFTFGGGAGKTKSTAPVGAGVSAVKSVNAAGSYNFTNTGLSLKFPQGGSYPNGNIWVTKLNQLPDSLPSGISKYAEKYWIIHNKGTFTNFTPLEEMRFDDLAIKSNDAANPAVLKSFNRSAIEHLNNWSVACLASSADAGSNGHMLFNNSCNIINGFSQFIVGSAGSSIFKADILSFTAEKENTAVLLKWRLAQGIDYSSYEVQRSANGINFNTIIGTVKGNNSAQYIYYDNFPVKANYYRLKLTDANGNFSYSDVVILINDAQPFIWITPNPVTENQILTVHNFGNTEARLTFYLSDGRLYKMYTLLPNSNTPITDLPKGVLIYKATNAGGESISGKQAVL
ncbi:MAG: LamG-like jellyroll fold domain-containing protein [Ferruginibacter sp.]